MVRAGVVAKTGLESTLVSNDDSTLSDQAQQAEIAAHEEDISVGVAPKISLDSYVDDFTKIERSGDPAPGTNGENGKIFLIEIFLK